eukprot:3762414-Rhodomonas_salina.1
MSDFSTNALDDFVHYLAIMLELDGPAFPAIRTQLKLHPPTSWLQVRHLAERAMSSSRDNGILPTPGMTSLNP